MMSARKTLGTTDKPSDTPSDADSASSRSKSGVPTPKSSGKAVTKSDMKSPASKTSSKKSQPKKTPLNTSEASKGEPAKTPGKTTAKTPARPAAKKPAAAKAKAAPARSAAKTKPKAPAKTTGPQEASAAKAPAKKSAKSSRPASAAAPQKPASKAQLPTVLTTQAELTAHCAPWRRSGETIALVPTMGALHDGHLALIEQASSLAKRVIVSIFVNPKQFAPNEDLERYPQDKDADLAKLTKLGVDAVWMPARETMYRDGFATRIAMDGPAHGLETDHRPHFFGGVTTVVAKLFNQVRPDYAVFGEKDFQQLAVIRRLVSDLDLGVEIVAGPTVRERDGLAMSSRNAYLNPKERGTAPRLHAVLSELASLAAKSKDNADLPRLRAEAVMSLITKGFTKVDYVEIRDAETLEPYVAGSGRPGRILAAAWLGRTRLIDNVPVEN